MPDFELVDAVLEGTGEIVDLDVVDRVGGARSRSQHGSSAITSLGNRSNCCCADWRGTPLLTTRISVPGNNAVSASRNRAG